MDRARIFASLISVFKKCRLSGVKQSYVRYVSFNIVFDEAHYKLKN